MVLKGKKVNLRPFRMKDAKQTLAWRNDPATRFLAMMHPYPVTKEMEQEWLKGILSDTSNRSITFAIETATELKLIGSFQLRDIQWIHRRGWLGITIGDESSRGKGFGEEAVKLGLDYALRILNLKKICLEVVKANKGAIRLYKKLGFVSEGTMKQYYFSGGCFHDVLIMSLMH